MSPAVVRGGNSDRRISFESQFRVVETPDGPNGILETMTSSRDLLGAIYLSVIWPAHKLLMTQVLKAGMADVETVQ